MHMHWYRDTHGWNTEKTIHVRIVITSVEGAICDWQGRRGDSQGADDMLAMSAF